MPANWKDSRTLAAKSGERSDILRFRPIEEYRSLSRETKVVFGQKRYRTLRNHYGTLQESLGNHIGITAKSMGVLAHVEKSLSARGLKRIPKIHKFKIR
jgi:hypothetical protein